MLRPQVGAAWMRAVTNPRLVGAMVDLLGEDVELHHSTMHVKPPSTGHPFPVHQDNAFYGHSDNRYVDCLVHLDDTCHENGEIRFELERPEVWEVWGQSKGSVGSE